VAFDSEACHVITGLCAWIERKPTQFEHSSFAR